MSTTAALLTVLPALSTSSIVLISFFVLGTVIILWGIYTARPMSPEEEEMDQYYNDLYHTRRS